MYLACSAGIFWVCECTFLYQAAILYLVTVEGWGDGKFAKGVGVRWKKNGLGGRGRGRKNN